MGKLIYLMNVSLDGFVETPDHSLDWTIVDDESHSWFNDQIRSVSATLYGRRLYELMAAYWPTAASLSAGMCSASGELAASRSISTAIRRASRARRRSSPRRAIAVLIKASSILSTASTRHRLGACGQSSGEK